MTDNWNRFDGEAQDRGGAGRGSEGGIIVRDEEHPLGARITLEKECEVAPYAITCGIYGWMMHTCFLSQEGEAAKQYEEMKSELGDLLERAETLASDDEAQRTLMMEGCEEFVERFP